MATSTPSSTSAFGRTDAISRDALQDRAVQDTTLRDTTVRDTTVRDTTVRDTTVRDTTDGGFAAGPAATAHPHDASYHHVLHHDEAPTPGDLVGEGVGGLSGAMTGAAIGSLGGPVGTIIGALAGAVGGWWSGRALSEMGSRLYGDEAVYQTHYGETSRGTDFTGTDFTRADKTTNPMVNPMASTPSASSAYASPAKGSGTANVALGRSPDATSARLEHSPASTLPEYEANYERDRPAYQIGRLAAQNPDYAGRSFGDVEADLERGWTQSMGASGRSWQAVRQYAEYGFTRGRTELQQTGGAPAGLQAGRDELLNAGHGTGAQRLTLSEEQLAVGKREVQAGQVELSKRVETARVQEGVQLAHDEVSIERRPLSGDDAAMRPVQIGDSEIRIPLMAEEAVVEKRLVPTEEVVIRTREVVENQTVEADLRRERLETQGLEGQRHVSVDPALKPTGATTADSRA